MFTFDNLPDDAYMRVSQLAAVPSNPGAPLPFSAPTIWRKVKQGTFPAPKKLSAGVTAWRVGDVRAWLAQVTA